MLLLLPAMVSVGGTTYLLPFTGITFPFISRGGTSLVVNLALVGLMTGISRSEQPATPVGSTESGATATQLGWVMASIVAPLLVGLALIQATGRLVAPGEVLVPIGQPGYPAGSAGDQWRTSPVRSVPGPIT